MFSSGSRPFYVCRLLNGLPPLDMPHCCVQALPQDATFEMERRRNRPEKYDRQLVHKTVKAMQKVDEVRNAAPRRETFVAIAHLYSVVSACSTSAHHFLMPLVEHPTQHL